MKKDSIISKLLGFLAGVVAFAMVATFIIRFTNAQFHFFLDDTMIYKVLNYITVFGGIVLALLVGGWAAFKGNWLIRIAYLLVAAVAIVFLCMPDVFTHITNMIPTLQA